ncbi:hypothetical protein [Staphylococcus saprophyticus]|uniref:hypothetical protein n=1 Tax=Staphylococcus saprophyticus TaxID=29385 RepID=UPI00382FD22A
MRTLLTFLSMPFSTIAIGLATNDFFISMLLAVMAGFGLYWFWDKFFDTLKKTESNGNC